MIEGIEHTFLEKVFYNENDQKNVFGMLTNSFRKPPSLFIIGAQKSGTSALYQFLVENKIVKSASRKEICFFNNLNNYEKGIAWYRSHFSMSPGLRCDATANYFESNEAPKRLHHHFPNAKLVLLLRNPIDRAYSHYRMAVKQGFEKMSFKEALKMEDERLLYGEEVKKRLNHNYVYQRLGYRTKGIYVNQLKAWLKWFPKEQIQIIQSERLFANSEEVCQNILSFLEVEQSFVVPFKQINKGGGNNLNDETRVDLASFYEPFNRELYAMLNQDFAWK